MVEQAFYFHQRPFPENVFQKSTFHPIYVHGFFTYTTDMAESKKILVVDDESSLVKLCQLVLESAGFEVRGAFSGKQALSLLTDEMPDLILLDVMMPGMNGIEVCREIRTNTQAKRVHIVMYTADSSDSTRRNSMEAGANDLLTKEIPIYDLPIRLSDYLVPSSS